jgi:hypothetical protein
VYLLMATVRASGELAQGQITSGFSPLLWKTLRKASHDEMDPERGRERGETKRDRGMRKRKTEKDKSQC